MKRLQRFCNRSYCSSTGYLCAPSKPTHLNSTLHCSSRSGLTHSPITKATGLYSCTWNTPPGLQLPPRKWCTTITDVRRFTSGFYCTVFYARSTDGSVLFAGSTKSVEEWLQCTPPGLPLWIEVDAVEYATNGQMRPTIPSSHRFPNQQGGADLTGRGDTVLGYRIGWSSALRWCVQKPVNLHKHTRLWKRQLDVLRSDENSGSVHVFDMVSTEVPSAEHNKHALLTERHVTALTAFTAELCHLNHSQIVPGMFMDVCVVVAGGGGSGTGCWYITDIGIEANSLSW